jgi:hypothetical protein
MSEDPKKPTDSSATTSSLTGQSQRQLCSSRACATIHETTSQRTVSGTGEDDGEISQPFSARTQCREHEASIWLPRVFTFTNADMNWPALVVGSAIDDWRIGSATKRGDFRYFGCSDCWFDLRDSN